MQLLTGGNGVLAAQLLYIHRNTFRYRLNKFIEQTGIDLRESTLAYAMKVYGTLAQHSSD
jgi:DNA-binding PucR family transcriptional regulator